MTERYDKSTETLWVASDADGETLVDSEELKHYSKALRAGELPDGRSVSHVHYVFSDKEGAAYNHQALAFSNLGTFVGTLDSPGAFDADAPDFETKKDFGM